MRADELGVISKLLEATLIGVLTLLYRGDDAADSSSDIPAIVRGE